MITLMSLITYGGASQFIIVSMLVTHSPMISIILSAFLVNSRMILMSTTLDRTSKRKVSLKILFWAA